MSEKLDWKVNTPGLLQEIIDCNPSAGILRVPLGIFGQLLAEVGKRAAQINDPQLNALMCRLAIYEIADPYSPHYDEARVRGIMELAITRVEQSVEVKP